ncbi:MAG: HAMP domain-containing sensor histidine kinase [Candidatus Nanopelagicales bacterium]|nr:HAMP domain-containing sensor histidine kinase [Candidatus Nanopelagicales bacterium]
MKIGLRTRVAIAIATLSFVLASVVAGSTYAFARWYLLEQRQSVALTRAVLDARAVDAALISEVAVDQVLAQVPSVGTSQPMLNIGNSWYTSSITISPDELPDELLVVAGQQGAQQRLEISGDPYYVAAVPVSGGIFVEVFPLKELDQTFTYGGWALSILTIIVTGLGAIVGVSAAKRVLVPLQNLGHIAQRITDGELSARIPLENDPDLDPLARSFNKMADAVQLRIARERRFAANVSHELRSPLTSILGTTELLDSNKSELSEQDKNLTRILRQQVQRLSRMLVDLLEISKMASDDAVQWENANLQTLCRDIVVSRGMAEQVVVGDAPAFSTDLRRFERIVGNLVENAVLHGGGLDRILIVSEPAYVRIFVENMAGGIPEESRERIFEPFVRGHGEGTRSSGAGLGLAIAHEQSAVLGGQLEISETDDGRGRFILTLPRVM